MKNIFDKILLFVLAILLIMIIPRHNNLANAQSTSNSPTVDQIINMTDPNTAPLLDNMLRQNSRATGILQGYFNANGLLATNAGGTGQNSSAWTAGDVVYLSSTGIWGHETLSTFPNGCQMFTSSGTWTNPGGITKVYAKTWGGGGGGGGGGASSTGQSGFSGSSADYSEGLVNVTGNVMVTIGLGGSGGAGGVAGSHGGTGGAGGAGGTSGSNGGSGAFSVGAAGGGGGGGGSTSFAGTSNLIAAGGAGGGGGAGNNGESGGGSGAGGGASSNYNIFALNGAASTNGPGGFYGGGGAGGSHGAGSGNGIIGSSGSNGTIVVCW